MLERRSYKKEIKYRQDNADELVEEFSTEIQSHNFGGDNYLSIEGVSFEYHKKMMTKKFLP